MTSSSRLPTPSHRPTRGAGAAALALSLVAGLGAGSAFAQSASGSFTSGGRTLEVRDAYAFRAQSSLGGDEVYVVAISNAGFVDEVLEEYWDRRRAIETYFRDDQTGIVYFEFRDDGSYRGLSYYWEPGNGCGFCGGGEVASTVQLRGRSLVGSVSGAEDGRSFEVDLDVRIAGNDYGKRLGRGGGEPGAAYLAYSAALADDDRAALKPLLSLERREVWEGAEGAGDLAGFLDFLRSSHPSGIEVDEAWAKGDHAILLVRGEESFGKVRGEVSMRLEDGSWRFEEETLELAPDP